jgi:hypothetical protein
VDIENDLFRSGDQQGPQGSAVDSQSGVDTIDRVFVFDGEHAIESLLVEDVDQARVRSWSSSLFVLSGGV